MKIIIKGFPKETAALVSQLQERLPCEVETIITLNGEALVDKIMESPRMNPNMAGMGMGSIDNKCIK